MLTYSIFYYFFWIATLISFARNDDLVSKQQHFTRMTLRAMQ